MVALVATSTVTGTEAFPALETISTCVRENPGPATAGSTVTVMVPLAPPFRELGTPLTVHHDASHETEPNSSDPPPEFCTAIFCADGTGDAVDKPYDSSVVPTESEGGAFVTVRLIETGCVRPEQTEDVHVSVATVL